MVDLAPAITTIIDRCLAVNRGEEVLVVVDPATRRMGEELREASSAAGADAVLMVMEARETDGSEPPETVAAALGAADVFIAPTSKSLSHTIARKRACDGGARGATMPGATEEMLARVMAVDFDAMSARSGDLASLLSEADEAHLTCPRGSDLVLDLRGREGISDDGLLQEPGAFGNLPCGEGFISPKAGEGRLVARSLASLGLSDPPALLSVEGGRLVGAEDGLGPDYIDRLQAHGESGTNLAELGIGTNDQATLTGSMLEDEKILGTAHVAFGASAAIGGNVSVPIHLDVVVLDPTLDVGGVRVLEEGRYVLGQPER